MILLEDYYLSYIKRLEVENKKNYHIVEVDGDNYIKLYNLIDCLEDVEDKKLQVEEKVEELEEELNNRPIIEDNSSFYRNTIRNLNELHVKYEELESKYKDLEEENRILRNETIKYCNEDMLDRLNMEGVEL